MHGHDVLVSSTTLMSMALPLTDTSATRPSSIHHHSKHQRMEVYFPLGKCHHNHHHAAGCTGSKIGENQSAFDTLMHQVEQDDDAMVVDTNGQAVEVKEAAVEEAEAPQSTAEEASTTEETSVEEVQDAPAEVQDASVKVVADGSATMEAPTSQAPTTTEATAAPPATPDAQKEAVASTPAQGGEGSTPAKTQYTVVFVTSEVSKHAVMCITVDTIMSISSINVKHSQQNVGFIT